MNNRSLPFNFAHRGARKAAPENTLAAFSAAKSMEADGVELDVIRCQTGEMVVTHDNDLSIWSNGRGRVSETSLRALKELDFGSHFGKQFAGEKIPTLQEVIDTLGEQMFINIEIKSISLRPVKEAKAVAAIISKNNLYDRVIVSSFNPFVLRQIEKVDPNIAIGMLFQFRFPLYRFRRPASFLKLQALHPEYSLINQRFIERAAKMDYLVNTWTVNDADEMRRLTEIGVNAIITDYPDRLKEVFKEYMDKGYSLPPNRRNMSKIGFQ